MSADTPETLLKTPLHALHVELGAKMVPFGGYDMPVQYATGILAEHKHTRAAAGLFDVSHMGQVELHGSDATKALETLVLELIQSECIVTVASPIVLHTTALEKRHARGEFSRPHNR